MVLTETFPKETLYEFLLHDTRGSYYSVYHMWYLQGVMGP